MDQACIASRAKWAAATVLIIKKTVSATLDTTVMLIQAKRALSFPCAKELVRSQQNSMDKNIDVTNTKQGRKCRIRNIQQSHYHCVSYSLSIQETLSAGKKIVQILMLSLMFNENCVFKVTFIMAPIHRSPTVAISRTPIATVRKINSGMPAWKIKVKFTRMTILKAAQHERINMKLFPQLWRISCSLPNHYHHDWALSTPFTNYQMHRIPPYKLSIEYLPQKSQWKALMIVVKIHPCNF